MKAVVLLFYNAILCFLRVQILYIEVCDARDVEAPSPTAILVNSSNIIKYNKKPKYVFKYILIARIIQDNQSSVFKSVIILQNIRMGRRPNL